MATVRYKTKSPNGSTVWAEMTVPDDAGPQDIVDHIEETYKQPVLQLEKVPGGMGEQVGELGKSLVRGFGRGSAKAADVIKDAAMLTPQAQFAMVRGGMNPLDLASRGLARSILGNSEAAMEGVLPKRPGFETGLERYARSAAEGAGGAAAVPMGGPVQTLGTGAATGLAGQAGADVTGSKVGEVVASLLAGLGIGGAQAVKPNAPSLARNALKGVPDEALAGAQSRMREMAGQGLPINLSQGMRTPSNIDDLVNDLAQSRFGDQTISNLRMQPRLLEAGSRRAMAAVPGQASSSQDIANRAQDAATEAISAARGRANAAYTGALVPGAKVPAAMSEAFERKLDELAQANPNNESFLRMLDSVRGRLRLAGTPAGEPTALGSGPVSAGVSVPGAPAKPGPWLDDPAQLKSAVDDAIQSYGRNALNTGAAPADLNRYASEIRNAWKSTVRAGTPGMEQAAGAARRVYETEVNPLRKSVVGRVAGFGANDAKEASDKLTTLFGKGTPVNADTSEILAFEKAIRDKHPGLFADAVATNLADRITKVLPATGSRTPGDLALDLSKALAGNPAQERGLRDMLAGAARSAGVEEKPVVDGFMRLVQMAKAAEQRPSTVSGLSRTDLAEVAGASKLGTGLQLQALYQMGKRIKMAFAADAYRTMDKILNDPDGLALLKDLSTRSVMSPVSQAAVSSFFGAQGQESPNKE